MKKNLFKKISAMAVASILMVGSYSGAFSSVANAATPIKGKIVVAGSTALLPLTLQAAKEFKKLNPEVSIAAAGAGSITGPQSVVKGSAQIGACDWDATTTVPDFKAFSGLVANKVAIIPFATIVNDNVKVDSLTTEQLQGIFTGKYTNWKQVGGQDADIIVVNRAFGSGTRVNYQMKALGGKKITKLSSNYKEVSSSGTMFSAVSTTPNSIGYIDLVYVKSGVKALKYNGVAATTANVINKTYPVWAYGYYLTKGQPTGATKAFIDYVQSAKFQQGSVKSMKFIPISSMK
jgi:phosphate transport system substrate-binding protein